MEPAYFNGGQRLGRTIEPKPRGKEDLVGVDVADSRDDVLVGQDGLERCRTTSQYGRETVPANLVFEGIEAEVR